MKPYHVVWNQTNEISISPSPRTTYNLRLKAFVVRIYFSLKQNALMQWCSVLARYSYCYTFQQVKAFSNAAHRSPTIYNVYTQFNIFAEMRPKIVCTLQN